MRETAHPNLLLRSPVPLGQSSLNQPQLVPGQPATPKSETEKQKAALTFFWLRKTNFAATSFLSEDIIAFLTKLHGSISPEINYFKGNIYF